MTKLNLGCGQNKLTGYVNVDKYDAFKPDVVFDLEEFPWPFKDNEADEIVLHHCLEHMGAEVKTFLNIMQELYRVSAPNGRIIISVPHPRSDGYQGDPTHVRPINSAILSLFSIENNKKWKELGWPNTPLATYINVDFEVVETQVFLMPYWAKQFQEKKLSDEDLNHAIGTFFNVVDQMKFTLQTIKPSRK